MIEETRDQATRRLHRIAGQVAGIEKMVEQDRYCVDILLQISAVRAAMDKLGKLLLEAHVKTCVADAMSSGSRKERDQKTAELLEVFSRFANVGGR